MPREGDALLTSIAEGLGVADGRRAETIAAAVLRPLCERLGIGLSARLTASLPSSLARRMRGTAAAGTRFSPVAAYLEEVAAAERTSVADARRHAEAVGAALAGTLPADVLAGVAAEVPSLAGALFSARPETGQGAAGSSTAAAARSMVDTMSSSDALPFTR